MTRGFLVSMLKVSVNPEVGRRGSQAGGDQGPGAVMRAAIRSPTWEGLDCGASGNWLLTATPTPGALAAMAPATGEQIAKLCRLQLGPCLAGPLS